MSSFFMYVMLSHVVGVFASRRSITLNKSEIVQYRIITTISRWFSLIYGTTTKFFGAFNGLTVNNHSLSVYVPASATVPRDTNFSRFNAGVRMVETSTASVRKSMRGSTNTKKSVCELRMEMNLEKQILRIRKKCRSTRTHPDPQIYCVLVFFFFICFISVFSTS